MVVRSGRLLPSVIVGALVTGALALGAGVAGADPMHLWAISSRSVHRRGDTRGEASIVTGLAGHSHRRV